MVLLILLYVLGRCCDVKGKGLYKVGDIIEVEEPSEEHCHRKTVKCGKITEL